MPHTLRGIVVEGTDCSGKTRLIKHLKAHLSGSGWDVLQMGHRSGDQFRRYFNVYSTADRLVLDRAHISESVYAELRQRHERFTFEECAVLDRMVEREFFTVLCTAPADELWYRYNSRQLTQPPVSRDELTRAREAFHAQLEGRANFIFESVPVDLSCEKEVNRFFEAAAVNVLECLNRDKRKPAS